MYCVVLRGSKCLARGTTRHVESYRRLRGETNRERISLPACMRAIGFLLEACAMPLPRFLYCYLTVLSQFPRISPYSQAAVPPHFPHSSLDSSLALP